MLFKPPRPPNLRQEAFEFLERCGSPAVRNALIAHRAPAMQPLSEDRVLDIPTQMQFNADIHCIKRWEAEKWLAWKNAHETWWTKAGVWAAIIAALLAALSCFISALAWIFPRSPA